MIQTSNFRRAGNKPNAISIAQGTPRWFRGKKYEPLCPSWDLIHAKINPEEYTRRYFDEVLNKLQPAVVLRDLGTDAILLCWEDSGDFCHRRIVAQWLSSATGQEVPEMEFEPRSNKPRDLSQTSLDL